MILSTPGQKRILLNYKREEAKKKSSQNGAKGRLEEIFAAFTILGVRDMSVCVSICLPLSVLSIVSPQSWEMVAWNYVYSNLRNLLFLFIEIRRIISENPFPDKL